MALWFVPIFAGHLYWEMPDLALWGTLLILPVALMSVTSAWWTTRSGAIRLGGMVLAYFSACMLIYYGLHFDVMDLGNQDWWWAFEFDVADWLMISLVSAGATALCIYGVGRQRRGEPLFAAEVQADQTDWVMSLFETPCPTTSAERAEVWGEVQGRGLPTLVWSTLAALAVPLLWFITALLDSISLWFVVTYGVFLIPLAKGTPSFGVRIKEGTAALSLFDATRPLTTAWLTFTKAGVAVFSITLGVLALLTSFWFAAPLVEHHIEFIEPIKSAAHNYVRNSSTSEITAELFVLFMQFATMVVALEVMQTAYASKGDRLTYGLLGLLVYGCILTLLIAMKLVSVDFGLAHLWLTFALIAGASVWFIALLWRDRVLSVGQLALIVGIWGIYALAYAHTLNISGTFVADTPAAFLAFRAAVCTLTLLVFVSAPLSFDRARHG